MEEKCACSDGEQCSNIECDNHPRWQMTRGRCCRCHCKGKVLLYRGECAECIADSGVDGWVHPVVATMREVAHLVKQ